MHPFLLADNRHYAFYVWRRVLNPFPSARYVLAPLYVASAQLWAGRLRAFPVPCARLSVTFTCISRASPSVRSHPPLDALLLLLGTLATLTPTPLIEPRYFLTPFLLLRVLAASPPTPPSTASSAPSALATRNRARAALKMEVGWYTLVNLVTVVIFLAVRFRWASEPGWQRFMW